MLHRAGIECCADISGQTFATVAIVAKRTDLDQLVALKGKVDFFQDGRSQAGLADHDHGMQVVGLCS